MEDPSTTKPYPADEMVDFFLAGIVFVAAAFLYSSFMPERMLLCFVTSVCAGFLGGAVVFTLNEELPSVLAVVFGEAAALVLLLLAQAMHAR